jgi:hypothetical protein
MNCAVAAAAAYTINAAAAASVLNAAAAGICFTSLPGRFR